MTAATMNDTTKVLASDLRVGDVIMPPARERAEVTADLSREGIKSLDQALYVASCFVASSRRREVAILSKVIDDEENYAVLDTPLATFRNRKGIDMLNDGWVVAYVLHRPNA